jgi:hypothetical protein
MVPEKIFKNIFLYKQSHVKPVSYIVAPFDPREP